MKIIICVKPTPPPETHISIQDGAPSWGTTPLTLSPFDGYAIEAALRLKDSHGATLTSLCIGNPSANDALKQSLAMGVDEAILIHDPALEALDTQGTARLLAAAVQRIDKVDLLIFGRQTLESANGLTPAQTARALAWPLLSMASSISIDESEIRVERHFDESRQHVCAELPAVLSVTQAIGEARYPTFAGIRKAAKLSIQHWSLADLGLSAPAPLVRRVDVFAPPMPPCEFISGASPEDIAERLAAKI